MERGGAAIAAEEVACTQQLTADAHNRSARIYGLRQASLCDWARISCVGSEDCEARRTAANAADAKVVVELHHIRTHSARSCFSFQIAQQTSTPQQLSGTLSQDEPSKSTMLERTTMMLD